MRVTVATHESLRFAALLQNAQADGFFVHQFEALVPFATMALSDGGRRILELPNAGGTSVASEVLSFELARMMWGARLSRTEMELEYFPFGSKITDYSVTVHGAHFGVSVTRAMKFRGTFTAADARALLVKKLGGVNASSRAVVQETWKKQILHVFAEHAYVADELHAAWLALDADTRSNTLVLCTVTKNARWLFVNCPA